MDWGGNFGVQYRCENGISLFCSRFRVSSLSIESPELDGRRSGMKRRTFEGVGLCRYQSVLRWGRWATLVFKVVGCAHVAGITVRNKTISVLLVPFPHAIPPGSGRVGSRFRGGRESAVERRSGGVGYAEDGMNFWTVPSVTVRIFDILLSSAETFSERRVLETGHGWRGRMGIGRVRGRVAYVVAVIGQEKTRDRVARRVGFVGVVSPLNRPKNKRKYSLQLSVPRSPHTTREIHRKYRIFVAGVLGSVSNKHVRTDHSPCPKLTTIKVRAE